jgi:hypothetical protein
MAKRMDLVCQSRLKPLHCPGRAHKSVDTVLYTHTSTAPKCTDKPSLKQLLLANEPLGAAKTRDPPKPKILTPWCCKPLPWTFQRGVACFRPTNGARQGRRTRRPCRGRRKLACPACRGAWDWASAPTAGWCRCPKAASRLAGPLSCMGRSCIRNRVVLAWTTTRGRGPAFPHASKWADP